MYALDLIAVKMALMLHLTLFNYPIFQRMEPQRGGILLSLNCFGMAWLHGGVYVAPRASFDSKQGQGLTGATCHG